MALRRISTWILATSACGGSTVESATVPFTTSLAEDSGDESDSSDADTSDEERLDLGSGGPGNPSIEGCNGIDFLFVIDNSSSMAAQQQRLLASFAGFITAIQASLADVTSYHVGVVTSDGYSYNEAGCQNLGDLVTRTGGEDSSNAECGPFVEGQRFATDMDDLNAVFPCMAGVGTGGSSVEFPVSAAIAALAPDKLAPGECNAGFVRDDAILVVVVVTDDPPFEGDMDDAHLQADTTSWHDAVVTAKHGNEAATVVIGFVPWNDLSCLVYSVDSPNLIEFVESFEYGVLSSVCAGDYASTFASTVATIQTSCEEFTPVG